MADGRRAYITGLLSIICMSANAQAVIPECVDYAAMNPIVAQWDPGFLVREFVVDGNLAYALSDDNDNWGLMVLDISDPSAPWVAGWLPDEEFNDHLRLDGHHLYVGGSDRLSVVDVSAPSEPVLMGWVQIPYVGDLAASGNLVCVANGSEMLRVVDVTNPGEPAIVGELRFPSQEVNCVAIAGTRAFVGVRDQGVFVVDVSDPTQPQLIPSLFVACHPAQIEAQDGLVWIRGGTLTAWDFSHDDGPVLRHQWSGAERCGHFAVGDGRAYVCDGDVGLHVLDVQHAGSVKETNLIPSLVQPQHVAILGDRVLVDEDYGSALTVIDPSIIYAPPAPIFSLDNGASHEFLNVTGGRLYDVNPDGLSIVDVARANTPQFLGSVEFQTPGYPSEVEVVDGLAYVALHRAGLEIIDVSNPRHPVVVSRTATIFKPADIAVRGSWVYLAAEGSHDEDGLVALIDAHKPQLPRVVATVELPHKLDRIAVVGDIVVVGTHDGELFTISNMLPSDDRPPTVLGRASMFLPLTWDLVVRGDIVFAIGGRGISMIDCADPTRPILIDQWRSADFGYQLAVAGDYLYAGRFQSGVAIFDVSARALDLVGYAPSAGFVKGVAADGDRLYLGHSDGTLQSLRAQCAVAQSQPTPLAPGRVDEPNVLVASSRPPVTVRLNLATAQRGEIAVYDLRGRRVATVATGFLAAGLQALAWDGRDGSGRLSAAGVYVLRLSTENGTTSRSFAMLR